MKKFAESYGLFEEYKNQSGKGIRKLRDGYVDLQSILKGRITIENKYYLKRLLIRECILEEKCNRCEYKDKRILSYSVPLLLDFIDGNQENQQFYNLRLLCPNCYFLEKEEKKVSQILGEYEEQIPSMNHWD